MAANVLVVANLTAELAAPARCAEGARRAVADPVTLVMPAQGPGLGGREAVKARLDEALEGMRAAGLEADGAIGDADPMEAVAECFDPARHDEAIVCTLPGPQLEVAAARLPAPRRALHRRAGDARGRRRPAPRSRDEPGADRTSASRSARCRCCPGAGGGPSLLEPRRAERQLRWVGQRGSHPRGGYHGQGDDGSYAAAGLTDLPVVPAGRRRALARAGRSRAQTPSGVWPPWRSSENWPLRVSLTDSIH